jgi:DNA-directed RNA polymerase subunit omega
MEKKGKVHLTNEDVRGKFKSSFDLVNYAIRLAENMIRTGRDARVKSEIQNRAMLILEEIHEGKDQFDEIQVTMASNVSDIDLEGSIPNRVVYEERSERRKYRSSDAYEGEE